MEHPLLTAQLLGLVGAIDGGSLWQPALVASVGDNAELTAFAWLGFGRGPGGTTAAPALGSEFAAVPDGLGLYARWFF